MHHQEVKTTIMIVDDTPANLDLLRSMLAAPGYRVTVFPSGASALSAAALRPPDLILLDILMPEMDGYETCRRLKASEALREIPVLFISALSETLDKVKAFSLGGVDYLTKPFQEEEVLARVRTHLQIRDLQRSLKRQNEHLEQRVAERTLELEKANKRLLDVDRLKSDFFRMISHELRTPATGVLGMAELILGECPESENVFKFKSMFRQSSQRLLNLINDATTIAYMSDLTANGNINPSLAFLIDGIRKSYPQIQVDLGKGMDPEQVHFGGSQVLWEKAMQTAVSLASCFTRPGSILYVMGIRRERTLCLRMDLDALGLSKEQAAEFFQLESSVRGSSAAQSLALAPVVAHKIFTVFGGDLRLMKGVGEAGFLEATLPISSAGG